MLGVLIRDIGHDNSLIRLNKCSIRFIISCNARICSHPDIYRQFTKLTPLITLCFPCCLIRREICSMLSINIHHRRILTKSLQDRIRSGRSYL